MLIKVFTTGGTIDKVYFDKLSEFQIGDPQIAEILAPVNPGFEWAVEPVLRKDSLDLTEADRALLRERIAADPAERVLVTHGTDTMRETARALAGIPGKTVVLTGALAPARFRDSDAVFNVGFALACVQTLPAGVYLAMNGTVFNPFHVRKNRSQNTFELEASAGEAGV
ncbi:MAG TPA: asparaginase domain-containing protein [Opitutaceae bacterium]|nr:asparaginase domain-containing protein [Opitutaceae bacterium]